MADDALAAAIIELERAPDSTPTIPGLSAEEALEFKSAIDSLHAVRVYADVSVDEFVSDVCDALRFENEFQPSDEPKFSERLSRVLNIDALTVNAKAVHLQNEHEHDFCDARILTDARPIYGDDVSAAPAAMIITHTLKLSFHEGAGGRLREIFISMGSRDIKQLHSLLIRAEAKARSLGDVIKPSNVRIIDPQQ